MADETPKRCQEHIYSPGSFAGHTCNRRAVGVVTRGTRTLPACHLHTDEAVARRRAIADARYHAKEEARRQAVRKGQDRIAAPLLEALEAIAEGSTDEAAYAQRTLVAWRDRKLD